MNNQLFLDKYKIIKTLGEGYSGVVKLGEHKENKNKVALKILNKNIPNYSVMIERLKQEAEIMKKLDHKNIVKFDDFHENGHLMDEEDNLVEDEIAYGSLEYITNGEIFDILFETGAFEQNTFKYYSK